MKGARNSIIASIIAIALVVGVSTSPVSAFSIQEIQAQIQTLVSRINVLQASPTTAPTSSVVASSVAKHRVCAALYRNLSHGSRGDDVLALQEFLRAEGYLSANGTGYFGSATRAALARWQASQDISAVGSLGPLSRSRIAAWCGVADEGGGGNGGVIDGTRFSASPLRGSVPLTVTFSTDVRLANPRFVADAGDYKIVFGDGSEQGLPCAGASAWCYGPHTATHTYASAGTYTASLVHYGYFGPPGPSGLPERTVASVTIYVGATSADPSTDPRCKVWYDGCNDCSRQYPGGPAACTLRACIWRAPAYCKEYFDGTTTNRPPTISSFSGPTVLNIDQMGTWGVQASDPENGPLSYRVAWGDEQYAAPMAGYAAESFVQTTTFTHAYARAGTYTVVIHVRDAAGQEAKTTATLRVEGVPQYCTMEYAPVCGQKTNCPACYYSEPACLMPCYAEYKTYGNRCLMNADGATLVHEGVCQNPPYQP